MEKDTRHMRIRINVRNRNSLRLGTGATPISMGSIASVACLEPPALGVDPIVLGDVFGPDM